MNRQATSSVTKWIGVLLCSSIVVAPAVKAQGRARCEQERRVQHVSFDGSPRFDNTTLQASIVTQPASWYTRWFRIGTAQCADSLEIRRDALRIAVLHRQAGWFQAMVQPLVTRTKRGVDVHFAITPGREAILDTIIITGLPDAPEGRSSYDAPLRALENKIFDRVRVDTTLGSVLLRLRNVGFARATRPENKITIDTANASVVMAMNFAPGDRLNIGEVRVEVQGFGNDAPRADSAAVMRLTRLQPGQRFRADAVLDAQRELYRTEAFRLVLIDTVPGRGSDSSSTIDLRISVAEAQTRTLRLGAGWATQDCVRVQGRVADRSFLGIGRRVELSARMSKLGVGKPADVAPNVCSRLVREDPFSQRVNYYVGASASNPRLFSWPVSPTINVYSERRGEPLAYMRETQVGALAEISKTLGRRSSISSGYQYENGRTVSDPVVSCTRFGQCRPEDIERSLFGRGISIVNLAVTNDRTNDIVNPRSGFRSRGELRLGETSSKLSSSVRFVRTTGEASTFHSLFGGVVGARLQLSRVFAPGIQLGDGTLLPSQERLYSGGQSSVRGFQQNLLGPLVYVIPSANDTTVTRDGVTVREVKENAKYLRAVPRGGTSLMVLNLEYRHAVSWIPIPLPLQLATFIDAGNVWDTQSDALRIGDVRATPGLGIRASTPVGAFRVDIGYQPYEPRAGRALEFAAGSEGESGRILCVSPGNTVSIDPEHPGDILSCPATYRPPSARGVLSRLVFHFGLGQAF